MAEHTKHRTAKGKAREHKRITKRQQPGRVGRRRSKSEQRKRTQNATSSTVRRARRGLSS